MYSEEFLNRYWRNVQKTDGCWFWIGSKDGCGYGIIKFHQKSLKAHRVAMILNGNIIDGKCVLHLCDNPGCINPDHLYLGTQKENALDRSSRGRSGDIRGQKNGRAKLSSEQVETIRDLFSTGAYTKVFLSHMFNVTDVQIGNIVRNQQWRIEL